MRDRAMNQPQVAVGGGILAGTIEPGTTVQSFKGIPFAAPPLGELRWRPPQPAPAWRGVRQATMFGRRALQRRVFDDMVFRSRGMSEDCLYLNVWAPIGARAAPVLMYVHGGGNVAGDGSEPRYDGTSLARRGIIVVTVNYRLNVFGFFAHPELTRESPQQASGNYGYLDLVAALQWITENIAAFGGDPARVTIAGESAGSIAVSALLAAPLAQPHIAGAIGSSGSLLGALPPQPLADAEHAGSTLATTLGVSSLAQLRALPARQLLHATRSYAPPQFCGTIDGWFLPQAPLACYLAGAQARVPLLVGWNSAEAPFAALLGRRTPTAAAYRRTVRQRFGALAPDVLQHYPAPDDAAVIDAATDLASDLFIGYSTWTWASIHAQTSGRPVYRYRYAHPRPPAHPASATDAAGAQHPPARGAVHSADIEYFMGTLDTNPVYAWGSADAALSQIMQQYYVNFVATGDPNGAGLTAWPPARPDDGDRWLQLDVVCALQPERHQARYRLLDTLIGATLAR